MFSLITTAKEQPHDFNHCHRSSSFFVENQYPDEAKREEIANACNSVIQKPGAKIERAGYTRFLSFF